MRRSVRRITMGLATALLGLATTYATPAEAAPPTPSFPAAIDGWATYPGWPASFPQSPVAGWDGCDNDPKPGVVYFESLLQDTYGVGGQISRACDDGGFWQSMHKRGLAFDWSVSVFNATQRAYAVDVLNWLFATDSHGNSHALLRRFGISEVIWDGHKWSAGESDDRLKSSDWSTWDDYDGADPHTSHVHFTFSTAGGAKQTSWWTVGGAPGPLHLLWMQRNSLSGGAADTDFVYGLAGDLPLVGDWDGNGTDTPGVYRPSTSDFYLKNTNSGGAADIVVHYGTAGTGQWPVVGDWDGNGTDTIGVFNTNNGQWLLRNSNSAGSANINTVYGASGDLPTVGDWDGNGTTTFGIRRGNSWMLRNATTAGFADITIAYGQAGDFPLVGDWNGNVTDGIGVVQGNSWLLRYSLSGGAPQITFAFGRAGDIFATGDWDGNGVTDAGAIRTV